MLHFAAQLGLTIAQLFLLEPHREQMRKGLLSLHLHGFSPFAAWLDRLPQRPSRYLDSVVLT